MASHVNLSQYNCKKPDTVIPTNKEEVVQIVSRPTLVEIDRHRNIETCLAKYKKDIERMILNSTAQLNKLSIGTEKKKRFAPKSAGFRQQSRSKTRRANESVEKIIFQD